MKAFYESRTYNTEIPVTAFMSENLSFFAHWHTDIEMIYVCEGAVGVGINSEYRILEKGGVAICGSGDIHYYNCESRSSTIKLIIFRTEILSTFKYCLGNLLPCSIFMDSEYFSIRETEDEILMNIRRAFDQIVQEMTQKQMLYPLFTGLKINELLLTLFRYFPDYLEDSRKIYAGPLASNFAKPMQKALKYLEENYTQDITLEQISEEANLSRFYFSRLFKKTTGMNFNAYLSRMRIDKAETLVRATLKPIIEIAYETGFFSIRTFNRLFRELKGCTPQSLRHFKIP